MSDPKPTAPTPDPKQPAQTRPTPGRIGAVLKVVRTLIAYANHFTAAATTRAAAPEFAPVAAVFGTYDLAVIMFRVKRGMLRAMALQRYLLARATRGRDLRFAWPPRVELQPHHRPPPRQTPATKPARNPGPGKDPALLDPGDPNAFRQPTPDEFDREVSHRPIGRTMAYICMDLGVVPGLCEGEFWNQVQNVLSRYGGSLNRIYDVRIRREKSFQRERDRRPETWHIDWRDLRETATRQALGCLIGEPLPSAGPLPVIVPS